MGDGGASRPRRASRRRGSRSAGRFDGAGHLQRGLPEQSVDGGDAEVPADLLGCGVRRQPAVLHGVDESDRRRAVVSVDAVQQRAVSLGAQLSDDVGRVDESCGEVVVRRGVIGIDEPKLDVALRW